MRRNEPHTSEAAQPRKRSSLALALIAVGWVLAALLLWNVLGASGSGAAATAVNTNILDTYERNLTNRGSDILEDGIPVKRTYQLSDADSVAPEPNPAGYGQTDDPAQMREVLDRAAELLDGQDTLFTTETVLKEDSTIHYYLDDTIFAVTWKQVVADCVYTFSEVKIADASQFRRFLADGKYNSGVLYTTTEMSTSVNAVVAASGDYYGYRSIGIVVNDSHVYRGRGHLLDTCYIDNNGDLLFTYAGEITNDEAAQKFVDDNNVRFSLCFGPVMVLDGEFCVPNTYNSGEINNPYARAALCQMGQLHYVVVAANFEDIYYHVPTVADFGRNLQALGIPTAYALDGGQTAAIVMDDQLINAVSYGSQREISDIIYFATAIPDNEVTK